MKHLVIAAVFLAALYLALPSKPFIPKQLKG